MDNNNLERIATALEYIENHLRFIVRLIKIAIAFLLIPFVLIIFSGVLYAFL